MLDDEDADDDDDGLGGAAGAYDADAGGELQAAGELGDADAGEEAADAGVPVKDIDAYWLQREVARAHAGMEPTAAQVRAPARNRFALSFSWARPRWMQPRGLSFIFPALLRARSGWRRRSSRCSATARRTCASARTGS